MTCHEHLAAAAHYAMLVFAIGVSLVGLCGRGGLALAEEDSAARPLGSWGRCIYVVNDHGQVLDEWLSAAAAQSYSGAVTVLHIDAHGDLNIPEHVRPEALNHGWLENATQRFEIADSADLANFQQIAAWAGLVDRVIWVRQGWGPAEHSEITLHFNSTTAVFSESLVGAELLNATDAPQTQFDSREEKRAEARLLSVHEIPEAALLDDDNKCSLVSEGLLEHLHAQTYILDIDLDFFVPDAASPGRPPWLESGLDCPTPCRRWAEPDCALWYELEAKMHGGEPNFFSDGCASRAVGTWQQMPFEQRELLKGLHVHEQLLVMGQLGRTNPSRGVEEAHVLRQISRLRSLLKRLGPVQPALVTIARSVDAFTGIFDAPRLEDAVIQLLQEIWGVPNTTDVVEHCVRYAAGTAPLSELPARSAFNI